MSTALTSLDFEVHNLIGGTWSAGSGTETIDVHNPATGEVVTTFTTSSAADIDSAVAAARSAQPAWAARTPRERSEALRALAREFEARIEYFVQLEVLDAGKPVTATRDEEFKDLVDAILHFAGAARVLNAQAATEYIPGATTFVRREPVGVVAAITPWNYPLWQAVWKIIPALAAGNAVVVKPAEITPLGTTAFVKLAQAFLPEGVLNIVQGYGHSVGEHLARHAEVNLVSFTGSTVTGRAVARAAADGPKRTVLELGGNAPVIVFDDANVTTAAETIVNAGLFNAGQECMAATRVIVHESIRDALADAVIAKMRTVVTGDPSDAATVLGPLISAKQRDRVVNLIESRPAHTKILFRGEPIDSTGYFVPATLIGNLEQNDDLVQQEIFGPVITVQTFTTEAQAVELANGVEFGLAGSVWTTDIARGLRVVNALDFGNVWINSHLLVAVDIPLGGFNQSGYGKEGGAAGIEEFTRVKQIGISLEN